MANLPHDFTYFQLLNLLGEFGNSRDRYNQRDFYTEQNVWHPIWKDHGWLTPFDLNLQYIDASFLRPFVRLGVQWRMHDTPGPLGDFLANQLQLDYTMIFHVVETDGSGIQIEHVWRRQFLEGMAYVRGFADHDINEGGDSDWVVGNQMGLRLIDELHAVAEFRYNSFFPNRYRSRWRFGLEYNISF